MRYRALLRNWKELSRKRIFLLVSIRPGTILNVYARCPIVLYVLFHLVPLKPKPSILYPPSFLALISRKRQHGQREGKGEK